MRMRIVAAGVMAGGLLLTGGCAVRDRGAAGGGGIETVSVEAAGVEDAALMALGVDDPTASTGASAGASGGASAGASAGPGRGPGGEQRRHRLRVQLRQRILHGEVVVETKDGPRTVVVQRGTVTGRDGAAVTVRSSDGYTATWVTDAGTRFVERGAAATVDQVDPGEQVAVAGVRSDPQTARLLVVPKA